jgi:SsrA-binding protein
MKPLAQNKKAYHNYEVLEKIEAGIELLGAEVKSIRAGRINLLDSYGMVQEGEIYLHHLHISPFEFANRNTPEPYRKRRLLLHKKQIIRLNQEVDRKQLALIPLSVYFNKQRVKVELGLCKGRKKFDKREKIADQESKRRLAHIMKDAQKR